MLDDKLIKWNWDSQIVFTALYSGKRIYTTLTQIYTVIDEGVYGKNKKKEMGEDEVK